MTLLDAWAAIAGVLLAAVAAQTALNLRRVPRLSRMPPPAVWPRIAVLIPARNEGPGIGAAVRAWAAQDYPDFEVVVYDDDSTDDTGAQARAAAGGAGHVRVVRGRGLPPGWRGKTHACHRLRRAARAEVLLFVDADITPTPGVLRLTAGALAALGADALSALPSHRAAAVAVRTLVALQNWGPFAFAPLWLGALARRPRFAVANGQFFAIRAAAYDGAGGFAAVRDSLGEDAVLGRRLVAAGRALALLDGAGVLTCRPYARLRDVWGANVRNLGVVFFGSTGLLLLAMGGLAVLYVAPAVWLGLRLSAGEGAAAGAWAPLALLVLGMLPRLAIDCRAGYGWRLALSHPAAVAALIAMMADSALRQRWRRGVEWRGRRYRLTSSAA